MNVAWVIICISHAFEGPGTTTVFHLVEFHSDAHPQKMERLAFGPLFSASCLIVRGLQTSICRALSYLWKMWSTCDSAVLVASRHCNSLQLCINDRQIAIVFTRVTLASSYTSCVSYSERPKHFPQASVCMYYDPGKRLAIGRRNLRERSG